jgi:pSer/pThr/pTyr-binding forkhead associated (FHA) protein
MIHILKTDSLLGQKEFKIGRGHDSDLRINDISVSRFHAVIRFRDNNFYL